MDEFEMNRQRLYEVLVDAWVASGRWIPLIRRLRACEMDPEQTVRFICDCEKSR